MSVPILTISPAAISGVNRVAGMLPLRSSASTLVDTAGSRFRITGTSIGGFQGAMQLTGTWNYPYRSITVAGVPTLGILDRLAQAGFNALRVLICEDVCTPGAKPAAYINPNYNPDWFVNPADTATVLDAVLLLDKVVAHCGTLGLRVIFDMHALAPNGDNTVATHGLWYTTSSRLAPSSPVTHTASDTRNEADWINAWTALARRYAGNPIVIGADLVNEPWAASWGDGNLETDICAAYTRCADAIHAVNPDWLVFCEGIADTLDFGPQNGGWVGVGWGAGLDRATQYPVTPALPNRVAYSPHDYGPGVGTWGYFSAPTYPANMPAVWNTMFGNLVKNDIAPVWIGEIGDMLVSGADNGIETPARYQAALQWIAALMDYCNGRTTTGGTPDVPANSLGFSWCWFCWEPNGYTGTAASIVNTDLLMGDFATLNTDVMQYLTPNLSPPLLTPIAVPVTLTLSAPATAPVTVAWETADGTAQAGVHYGQAGGNALFQPGQSSAMVVVPVLPIQGVSASAVYLTIVLSHPEGCTLVRPKARVTITYA